MSLKKLLARLCLVWSYALKCVASHLKIVVVVTLALVTLAVCYVIVQQGIFDPQDIEVVEVPYYSN